jgi:transcriptional regulator with XRE-family HTH domain
MPVVKGREIRERRQALGVKLGPFAELAGVKYKTLANIESGGQKFVSIEVIVRIARELPDTAPEDLLADEDAEEAPEPVLEKAS